MHKEWINALSRMTYGIYVLTTGSGDRINGMIASWVTQISFDPPLILAAVHPNRFSHGLLEQTGSFALHVVAQDQTGFLKRFKGPDPGKKFDGLQWRTGRTGVPVLEDCTAWFELEIIQTLSPGNHTLFIGQIIDSGTGRDHTPMCTQDYKGMYLGDH